MNAMMYALFSTGLLNLFSAEGENLKVRAPQGVFTQKVCTVITDYKQESSLICATMSVLLPIKWLIRKFAGSGDNLFS